VTHLLKFVRHGTQAELAQLLIKPCCFGWYSAGQCRGDKFVKGQKLVHRHRFEIIRFHFFKPRCLSLSKAASAQGPILGHSGPLHWSKKAKNECPNPHGRSTIVQRLPFRPLEVALGSGYSTGKNPRSMHLILFDGRLNRRQNPSQPWAKASDRLAPIAGLI